MAELKIIYRNPADLIPYVNNAKTHGAKQIDAIAASIKEFGFNAPILTDGDSGLVAGHGRREAAIKLGLKQVPTVDLSHLSEAQKKAYILADNRLGEIDTSWDMELVNIELDALADMDFDIELTGFDFEIDEPDFEGLTDPDAVPDVDEDSEPVSQQGMIWLCGEHRVMCGDSTSKEDVSKLMSGRLADMLLTDPPYNVSYKGKTKDALEIKNDEMSDSNFRLFLTDSFAAADENLKEGGVFYIWHADTEGYNFRGACMDSGWKVRQCIIWNKHSMVMGRQDYHWKHEPCLYGWKDGAAHLWASDRKQTTVINYDKPMRNGEHPTMKPVGLFEYQILNNTKGQDLVLDLFGGSGTTLMACESKGRISNSMELGEKYVDVIIKRWQDFTGKQATLEGDGRTFSEISEL